MVVLVLSGELLLAGLELSSIEVSAGVDVSEDVDSLADITLHASDGLGGPFSIGRPVGSGSHLLNFLSKVDLSASRSSTGEHHVKGMGGSRGLQSVLAGSSTNVDSDGCRSGSVALGNDSNSIRQSSALESTVVFERLGNLSGRKLTEVLHDRSLGELHMGLSG